jgi:dipeptidyl aminopeptidase/acylaminoacyl peptidase
MPSPEVAPYGAWKSPITADLIVAGGVLLGQLALDGEDVYWLEGRPLEGGRSVIVRRTPDGRTEDVNPPPFNARTRVHEYGGGSYTVRDGVVYFVHFPDQRVYRQAAGGTPSPLTPEGEFRFADMVMDPVQQRLIAVREDQSGGSHEQVNTLVAVPLAGESAGQVLVSGANFYSSPRLSPDGTRLAWLSWNHPDMPWDATELWVSRFRPDGSLEHVERVAGGPGESIFQPEWSPDGMLHFVSDRTGWWNLYSLREHAVEPLCEMPAEFGLPQWVFGMSTYGFVGADEILCGVNEREIWRLGRVHTGTGHIDWITLPYTDLSDVRAARGRAALLAGSPTEPASVVQLDPATGEFEVLRRAVQVEVDAGYFSIPEAIEYPTEAGESAFAFFYAPRNRDFVAPPGERPPLLVRCHGGPTAATSSAFSPKIQYWTSRGIAVLDVNYGGSTGYGRAFRQRLEGHWGIVDVDDCVNGALFLARRGDVDGDRLAISGGSAGGYTVLCVLTFRSTFRTGASHFGVSDLEALTRDTHKFESRYLDRLVGPYPERRDLYLARSPIHFTGRLSCPIIFFQGLEDRVVPPDQAEKMVAALREKGLPVAYVAFEGEQHGFRRAENIKRALEGELYFYSRILGFPLADPVEPVPIENLPGEGFGGRHGATR